MFGVLGFQYGIVLETVFWQNWVGSNGKSKAPYSTADSCDTKAHSFKCHMVTLSFSFTGCCEQLMCINRIGNRYGQSVSDWICKWLVIIDSPWHLERLSFYYAVGMRVHSHPASSTKSLEYGKKRNLKGDCMKNLKKIIKKSWLQDSYQQLPLSVSVQVFWNH